MSDTITSDTISALKVRERDLELEACAVKARVEEVRDLIALLESGGRRRPGRPRRPIHIINPMHVQGALHEASTEPHEAA